VQQKIEPPKRRASTNRAPLPDLSRKMLMRALVSTLETQQSNIELLITSFKRKLMADDFQVALPRKPGPRRNIKDLKA
jgi:hypothetical protein